MPGTRPGMTDHSNEKEARMTAYLVAPAIAGLVAIAVWEGFS